MHCIHCINISVRQIFYMIKIDEVGFSQMAAVTIKGNFGLGLLCQSTIFVRVTRQIGQRVQVLYYFDQFECDPGILGRKKFQKKSEIFTSVVRFFPSHAHVAWLCWCCTSSFFQGITKVVYNDVY